MSDWVIETAGLRKTYGRKTAVADLSLQVAPGEVFGFLGPNGAGKSTALKMLLGLVRPSGGTARVLGRAPGDPAALARIGFLPEHFRFHEWLRAAEFLDLHGRLYGLDRATRRARVPALLARVGLSDAADRPLSAFSKGMLQRIGLAQALLATPALVLLDEPTSALDPLGRRLVRQIIHELRDGGTTVFLNSHLLGEVEATCDRVAFIKRGRVLRSLRLGELPAGQLQVELTVTGAPPGLPAALAAAGATLPDPLPAPAPAAPGAPVTWLLTVPDEDRVPALAAAVIASGAALHALTPRRATLEQIFLDIVGAEDSGQ